MAKHVDLDDPEAVKEFIAGKKCANSHKNGYVKAYDHYVKFLGYLPETTLIYTQLVDFGEDEWTHGVATTIEEACELIDAGFEYVAEMEGAKIFRK